MKNNTVIAALLLCAYLGIYNGYIALFNIGAEKPEKVFPYRVAVYPQQDQRALEAGIPVQNEDTLKKRLEDFLS